MSIHDNVFDLIDEMTEPTGPILSWKAQVHIKQFLTRDEHLFPEQYQQIGTQIANKLQHCALFMETNEALPTIYDLEHAPDRSQ